MRAAIRRYASAGFRAGGGQEMLGTPGEVGRRAGRKKFFLPYGATRFPLYIGPMTYPVEFRRKVLSVKKSEGLTYKAVAERFEINPTTIQRWEQRIEPKPHVARGGFKKIDLDKLAQDVRDRPGDLLRVRGERFGVTRQAISLALKKLGMSPGRRTKPRPSDTGT